MPEDEPEVQPDILERYKQERAKAREVLEKLRTALSEALVNS